MADKISFTLNQKPVSVAADGDRMLLWFLRTELELTGTKFGCGKGLCGACTVLVGNNARRSCQIPMNQVQGKAVTTIEGLSKDGKLHPVQQAFVDHGALQCGFCTPGMVLKAYSLLLEKPRPTRGDIIQGMEGNLCRCGAYKRIVEAIEAAAKTTQGGK